MSIPFKLGRTFSLGLLLLAGLHCGSAASDSSASNESKDFTPAPGDTSEPTVTPVDAGTGPQPPRTADSLTSGILLVNASDSFPAFRICPITQGETGNFSSSANVPIPTKLMPRSNLAGVGVGGAATIDVQRDFAGDSEVLLLKIDDTTKNKAEQLATESCRALACTEVGGSCLGAGNVVRVPLVDAKGSSVSGALASPGAIVALRGEGPTLRLEVIPVDNLVGNDEASLRSLTVKVHNLSSYVGPITYTSAAGTTTPLSASTAIDLGADDTGFVTSKFTAGGYSATLTDVHQNSDPRTSIAEFYSSPGAFALVLVGSEADVGADRRLRFLAVPVTAPKLAADAGSPDAAVPTGDQ
jgi:hypothetical protein